MRKNLLYFLTSTLKENMIFLICEFIDLVFYRLDLSLNVNITQGIFLNLDLNFSINYRLKMHWGEVNSRCIM